MNIHFHTIGYNGAKGTP